MCITASKAAQEYSAVFSGDNMAYGILDCFMISAACGFFFGVVYEVLRIIRRIIKLNAVTFICDVLFFIIAGFTVVSLSLYLGNYIRIYTIMGFGAGVFSYIQTLGRICSMLEELLFKLLRNTIGIVFISVAKITRKLIGIIAHKSVCQFRKINDFFVRTKKKSTSLLHFRRGKLYNNKRENIAIGESSRGKHVIQANIKRSS